MENKKVVIGIGLAIALIYVIAQILLILDHI
jgi:preprotein translocase subunit Sec61beta